MAAQAALPGVPKLQRQNLSSRIQVACQPAPPASPQREAINPMTDTVLIIDFGSQVTQLIARRVREAGVYSEIVPFDKAEVAIARLAPKALILSGGPASVTTAGSPRAPQAIFQSGLPILSICYGQQTTAVQLGGTVEGGHAAEGTVNHVGVQVDEPRRSRHAAAGGLHGQGDERERALRHRQR